MRHRALEVRDMPTEPERIRELVRQMNDTAGNVTWELEPEDIRAAHRRRPFPALDPKAAALVAAAIALIVVGYFVFRPAPHSVSTASTTTTTPGSRQSHRAERRRTHTGRTLLEVLGASGLDVGTVSVVTSTQFAAGDRRLIRPCRGICVGSKSHGGAGSCPEVRRRPLPGVHRQRRPRQQLCRPFLLHHRATRNHWVAQVSGLH